VCGNTDQGLAVWNLRKDWKLELPTSEKLKVVALAIDSLGGWSEVEKHLSEELSTVPCYQNYMTREENENC